jgi:hypothetical protein
MVGAGILQLGFGSVMLGKLMWLKKNLFPNDECRDHVANIYSMK